MSARTTATASDDGRSVTVHVPLKLRRRGGGRKRILTPHGAETSTKSHPSVDSTLVKALARAQRWQRLLESGAFGSVAELARAERINASYVAKVLRLTLLAPEIVEAVLNGTHNQQNFTLGAMLRSFPIQWHEQVGG